MPMQLTLIAIPDHRRDLRRRAPSREQIARPCDARMRQKLVRWDTHVGAEGADQMVFVEADVAGEVGEADVFRQALERVGAGAAQG